MNAVWLYFPTSQGPLQLKPDQMNCLTACHTKELQANKVMPCDHHDDKVCSERFQLDATVSVLHTCIYDGGDESSMKNSDLHWTRGPVLAKLARAQC